MKSIIRFDNLNGMMSVDGLGIHSLLYVNLTTFKEIKVCHELTECAVLRMDQQKLHLWL